MGNIMGRFLELLREFDVVDLSPTLENDIPRWPTPAPRGVRPPGAHAPAGSAWPRRGGGGAGGGRWSMIWAN